MKIALSISTYNRKQDVINMINSLKKIKIPKNVNIRIYDDKSTEYDKEFLNQLLPEAEIVIRETNLKADRNMRQIHIDFLETKDDILIQVDSDVIFNEKFFEIINKLLEEEKINQNVFSLYNSINHKEINTEIKIGGVDFVEKKSIGGLCVIFFDKKLVQAIVENISDGDCYDWRWSDFILNANKKIYVSKISYIQHMGGINGQNNKCDLNIDFGKGFEASNLEDLKLLEKYEKFVLEKILVNKNEIPIKIIFNNLFSIKNIINLLKRIIRKFLLNLLSKIKNCKL